MSRFRRSGFFGRGVKVYKKSMSKLGGYCLSGLVTGVCRGFGARVGVGLLMTYHFPPRSIKGGHLPVLGLKMGVSQRHGRCNARASLGESTTCSQLSRLFDNMRGRISY